MSGELRTGERPAPAAVSPAQAALSLDGLAQAELIRRGELRSSELVEAAIERIEALDPQLNCVVVRRFDEARFEAARADGFVARSGAFAGVPALLKDLGQQIAGVAQTDGSRAGPLPAPALDGNLAARYRAAGVILLGKTSSPEFGNHSTTEPAVHGPCRNPWNLERTVGGSSGGSGAAVAARMVAVAGASDGAGSIRIPSSCCGVFGLKPTRGRISSAPYSGDALFGLGTSHAITRSVRDSAALLDLSGGAAPGDYWWLPPAPRPFLAVTDTPPRRLRIGMSTRHLTGGEVHADCVSATEATAALLSDLGHEVALAEPSFDASAMTHSMLALWAVANASGEAAIRDALGRPLGPDELEPTTWELVRHAQALGVTDLVRARDHLQLAAWQIAEFFADHDLWLSPTLAQPPAPLGELNRSLGSAAAWWEYDLEFNPFNPVANIAGLPAASLPLHFNDDGLPIGSLLTAGFGCEAALLQVCAQLERAQPWSDREPPVIAGVTGSDGPDRREVPQ